MAKISVIIPVYNVEKYLRRCLESLKRQSFDDWEAVCVDDGSTDGCPGILDVYADSDKRFKVIHKVNGGVSEARNEALAHVSGEFLMFVDSDDFLHPQAMEICLGSIKDGVDLVAFTYNRAYHTAATVRQVLKLESRSFPSFRSYDAGAVESMTTDDIFDWATERSRPDGISRKWAVKHCQPWRCLYRASTYKDLKFTEGIMYEDFPWWSEVLLRTGTAVIINLPLYYYYPNFKGFVHSADKAYRIRSLKVAIAKAELLFDGIGNDERKRKWERNFLAPFKEKLKKKEKK